MTRIDQLEKQRRPVTAHWQIADPIHDQRRRLGQHSQTARKLACRLGLPQRFDQPGQGAEANPAPGFGGANGQANSQATLADSWRTGDIQPIITVTR